MCCNKAAAETILEKLKQSGINTILVAWESMNIKWLTRALGVPTDKVKSWNRKKNAYDWIYELKYTTGSDGELTLSEYDLTMTQGFGTLENPWLGPESGCGEIPAGDAAKQSLSERMEEMEDEMEEMQAKMEAKMEAKK